VLNCCKGNLFFVLGGLNIYLIISKLEREIKQVIKM
jgi:hypothetical protein